jgi:gag-polypeptide of LTR copia-type
MDDFMSKKRPAPILSRENNERWFRIMELHFKGEGLWKIVVNGAALLDTFEKDDAKAQYILDICIGDGDRERVQECKTARDIWTTLKKKYDEKRPLIGRHYLQEYVIYRMLEDGSIQETWTEI